jgi:ABC-type sugar transport system substrate-binding protein
VTVLRKEARQAVVVVGYDGSPASRSALERGARRVGRTGRLILVHAFGELGGAPGRATPGRADRYARTLSSALAAIRDEVPDGVAYEIRLVTPSARDVLVETAERHRAKEIVGRVPAT